MAHEVRENQKESLGFFLEIIGNILVLGAIILLFYYKPVTLAILVTLSFAICYAIITWLSRKVPYLYLANILFSASYILFLTKIGIYPTYHLYAVPLVALFYGLGLLFERRYGKKFSTPFNIIGHLTVFFLIIVLLLNQSAVNATMAIISMAIYFLIYLIVMRLSQNIDYLFGAVSFIALIYYFLLKKLTFVSPENHLYYFTYISLVLALVGYILQRRVNISMAKPLYAVAISIALASSAMSLFTEAAPPGRGVLIISSIVYAIMMTLFRKDVFVYLISLTLGLLFYNFLQGSENPFTRELVIYFLFALAVLGSFFVYPHAKRFFKGKRPLIMLTIVSWKGRVLYSIPILGVIVLIGFLYLFKSTELPQFCNTCHYMDPYVESWSHSTHNKVKCIECHYEPGLRAEVRGKMAGLIQMAKYATHTYSVKPRTEISDASCLKGGCHAKMDVSKEVVYRGKIRFNHQRHLMEPVRGKRLRCTTCHSQLVQGEHLAVTESVCFICHFKGRGERGTAVGKCRTCHGEPKGTVEYRGVTFNHIEFLEGRPNIECVQCHTGVTEGQAKVPEERCFSCHMERGREYADRTFLHDKHVTEHKVECFECHVQIRHGLRIMAEKLAINCGECHGSRHVVSEKMYMGIGGAEVENSPDPMFLAGVVCGGCHKERRVISVGGHSFQMMKATYQVCNNCHEEGYGSMAKEWRQATKQSIDDLRPMIRKIQNELKVFGEDEKQPYVKEARRLFRRAKDNYDFIVADGSYGVHNIAYTEILLSRVEEDLNACLRLLDKNKIAIAIRRNRR